MVLSYFLFNVRRCCLTKFSNYREIGTRTVDALNKSVLSPRNFARSRIASRQYRISIPRILSPKLSRPRVIANRSFYIAALYSSVDAPYFVPPAEVSVLQADIPCKYSPYMRFTYEIENDEAHRVPPYIRNNPTFAAEYNAVRRALRYSDFTPALCLSRQKNITGREVNRRRTYVLH